MRPPLAQPQHRLHHGDLMRLAVLQRRVRALRQTRGTVRDIPAEPFVAGLPADPVLTAQHRHLILARQNPSDKLQPLVHVTGLFPRHRQVPPARRSNLSPIHPVNSVTCLSGPYTGSPLSRHAGEGLGRRDPLLVFPLQCAQQLNRRKHPHSPGSRRPPGAKRGWRIRQRRCADSRKRSR